MLRQPSRFTSGWLMLLCGCGLLLSGCDTGGPEREMATVSGKVTLNGEPLEGGAGLPCRVTFAHVEGPGGFADIQSDGTYSAEVAVGQTRVSIYYRDEAEPVPGAPMPDFKGFGKNLVPVKYVDAETSGLSLDVKSGKNEFNIEMEGKVD